MQSEAETKRKTAEMERATSDEAQNAKYIKSLTDKTELEEKLE